MIIELGKRLILFKDYYLLLKIVMKGIKIVPYGAEELKEIYFIFQI